MTGPDGAPASGGSGDVSMYVPTSLPSATALLPWAALAAESGAAGLWTGQSLTTDVAVGAAYAAGRGVTVPLRTGVNVMPSTTPYAAALQIRGLVETVGHPVVSCWSPGDPMSQAALGGGRYESPLTATREFVAALRGLLAGEQVSRPGEYFPTHGRLLGAPVGDRVQIGLGVLRPRMAELAGEIADTVVTWMACADYVNQVVVPATERGAAAAQRARPRVVATFHAIQPRPGTDVVALAQHAVGFHVDAPHYRDMLARSGHDLGGLRGVDAVRRLLDDEVVVVGGPDRIASAVAEFRSAGADEVAVVLHHAPGTRWAALRDDWSSVLGATRAAGSPTAVPTP